MAANPTTTYASQILDLLGLSKFKGGNAPQARIQGGGVGGRDPPCSRPPIFFSTNFLTSKKKNKKKSLGIFYGRYVP